MATPSNGASGSSEGNRNLCGAPFPPRPKAIATFLSSSDFLHGCQTLLHSLKRHLAPTPQGQYPPEIIVLLSSKVSNPASKRNFLHPIFCDRIIRVDHIPIGAQDPDENGSESKKPSHVKSWDENCGWTKLRLFELDGYDTILYIDADCLVVKDVGHLLHIDDPTNSPDKDVVGNDEASGEKSEKITGLLAAAPDIFPPDKFNAGVMVLRPSKSVFDEMMTQLPNSTPKHSDLAKACKSYDGGDTGFLNNFYPGWYSDMPYYSRLPFGYNAQRFMHHCTHEKQPKYWDEAIDDIRIIHFSSSPKPWEKNAGKPSSETKDQQSYLDEKDANTIQTVAKRGKLESMWQAAYERSQQYYVDQLQHQSSSKRSGAPRQKAPPARAPTRSPAPAARAKPQNAHRTVGKRFRELRKTGMGTKEAMESARAECGLDKADEGMDPGRAVGQMFGLM